jgi:hypothetical protein
VHPKKNPARPKGLPGDEAFQLEGGRHPLREVKRDAVAETNAYLAFYVSDLADALGVIT